MNGWKVTAIIFIILFLLSAGMFIWLIVTGLDIVEKETECMWNICEDAKYDAYLYDSYDGICYCYEQGEVTKQNYIG